jgi:RNA polymerase sigma factor (sigma-70 family)
MVEAMPELEDDLKRIHESKAAYERLYHSTRSALLPRLEPMLPPELRAQWDAEDLFEEAFIKAIGNLQKFEWRGEGAWYAFLTVIADHIIKDALRRKSRVNVRLVAGDSQNGVHASKIADPRSNGVGTVTRRDTIEEILCHLSARDAELVRLKYLKCLSDEEIAARVGKSVVATRKAIHRALERFADIGLRHMSRPPE